MTQLENQPRNNKTRNVGIVGGTALALAIAFGAGGALNGNKDTAAATASPEPTTAVTATPKASEAGATPTPKLTETAMPTTTVTPEPSITPEPIVIQNIEVEQLTPFEVMPGDFISADVQMSDTKDGSRFALNDSDWDYLNNPVKKDITRTALGVDVEAPGWVVAPYGKITVMRGMTPAQKAEFIVDETSSKIRSKAFDEYNVVVWTGLDSTSNQAGLKFDGTPGTTSENPTGLPPTAENLANLTTQEKLRAIISVFEQGNIDVDSPEAKQLIELLAECLCGCAVPTESPMPSQTPGPTAEVCVPKMTDLVIPAGTVWESNGQDFIVEGAVRIDGVKRYTIGNDSSKIKQVDWVTDGGSHKVIFDFTSDRQLFNSCSTDAFEKITYDSDLSSDKRTLDPKSITLK